MYLKAETKICLKDNLYNAQDSDSKLKIYEGYIKFYIDLQPILL